MSAAHSRHKARRAARDARRQDRCRRESHRQDRCRQSKRIPQTARNPRKTQDTDASRDASGCAESRTPCTADAPRTAAIPAQTAAETAGGSAVSPNSIDAAGGVQSGHTAGRAMAYRRIRAATAQMAGRQSFRNTGDVGLSCTSRRAGRGPRPANTAGIVGIVRIASMQLTLAQRAIAR